MTGTPLYESEEIVRRISRAGKHAFGPYPENIANSIGTKAKQAITNARHPLIVELLNISNPEKSEVLSCSFCGKVSTAVEKMLAGKEGSICNECVVASAGVLQDLISSANLNYTYQLLDWHFGKRSPDQFVKTNRNYPGRVRADLQLAIDELFISKAIRSIGIKQQYGYEKIDLTTLWTSGRNAHGLAPISFEELDVGESEPVQPGNHIRFLLRQAWTKGSFTQSNQVLVL